MAEKTYITTTYQDLQVLVFHVGHVLQDAHHYWPQSFNLYNWETLCQQFFQFTVPFSSFSLPKLTDLRDKLVS